jgi:hypothetical protein
MIEAIYDRVNVGTRVVILPRTTPAVPPVDAGISTTSTDTTPPPPSPAPSVPVTESAIQPYAQPKASPASYTQQNGSRRRGAQSAPSETEERIIIERPE